MAKIHNRREVTAGMLGVTGLATLLSSGAIASTSILADAGRTSRMITIDSRPEPITIDLAKTAVVVIDMQNDFGATGGMFDRAGIDISGIRAVVPQMRSALAAARAASLPIFYLKMAFRPDLSDAGPPTAPNLLKHAPLHVGAAVTAPDGTPSRILIRDTWNTEIIPELRPAAGDAIVYKSRFSGFYRTELDDLLKGRGIETLIVTGCTTSVCVESTVRDAMFRDYRCIVLEDCTAEPIGAAAPRSNHEASLLTMQILFAWISDSAKLSQALSAGATTG
jgi:ureidoacrylate peracid hydrolase